AGTTSSGSAGQGGATGASTVGAATTSAGAGGDVVGPRALPDTSSEVSLLVDRLPVAMSPAQLAFAASRFAGTRRITSTVASALRAYRPGFIVLHERLAHWQGGENLEFLIDGKTWGSDYATVAEHEPWFWHLPDGKRVASALDGKWLMNVADTDYRAYWAESVAKQVELGDFDGVVAAAGSPTVVLTEGMKPVDARLAGKGVVTNDLPELGGFSYGERWEDWAKSVSGELAAGGLPLFMDIGSLEFDWDDTNYVGVPSGVLVDISRSATASVDDWLPWMNRLLQVTQGRPAIVKARLDDPTDRERRRYFLGIYLLVKGAATYLDVHASNAMEWYPEWAVKLGAPLESATSIDQLVSPKGIFRRRFEKGWVYVNPTDGPIPASFESIVYRVAVVGGGTVFASGNEPGAMSFIAGTDHSVAAHSAEVLYLEKPTP
ncbi:MAG: hypothetical protein FJ096_21245, partial [Deltaproteobacteria bacterium]|nr:hypothetical protein [Deltaproteobacteria bacterium]